ncbi:hypothetical protein Ancab_016883 [Ancistrocladus abbreviatus]
MDLEFIAVGAVLGLHMAVVVVMVEGTVVVSGDVQQVDLASSPALLCSERYCLREHSALLSFSTAREGSSGHGTNVLLFAGRGLGESGVLIEGGLGSMLCFQRIFLGNILYFSSTIFSENSNLLKLN